MTYEAVVLGKATSDMRCRLGRPGVGRWLTWLCLCTRPLGGRPGLMREGVRRTPMFRRGVVREAVKRAQVLHTEFWVGAGVRSPCSRAVGDLVRVEGTVRGGVGRRGFVGLARVVLFIRCGCGEHGGEDGATACTTS